MTVRDALREGAAALAGTETPFLDASLLLADSLETDTAALLASSPETVAEAALERFRSRLASRSRGVSVAYILGRKEFWGRSFKVDERVLVPRPDTETLVDAALKLGDAIARGSGPGGPRGPGGRLRVHEACCGSGCVAVSLAADRPEWSVSASDLSEGALEVAAANAEALLGPGRGASSRPGGALGLGRRDLLSALLPGGGRGDPAAEGFDLVVANPPYVPSAEAEALLGLGWSEPRMALDGGGDGLDLIRRLVPEAELSLAPGGALLVEADGEEARAVAELFRASRFIEIGSVRDLGGRPRVTSGRKPWRT
jgi:release factor glutamine methyltransferase